MRKLYIVRHGETDYNVQDRFQGQGDVPLNDTGKSQARELQKIIEKLNIDLIITSPVLRARQTAEILNIHHIPIIESSNFSERNMGVYEGLTRQEVQEKYPDLWKAKITRQYDNAPTGGETIREVEKRIFSKLDELSLLEVGNILVVSHFFPLRVINKYFNPGLSDEDFFNFMMKNSEIREYDF